MRRRRETDKNAWRPGFPIGNPGRFLLWIEGRAYSSGAMFGSLALTWFRGLQMSGLRLSKRS